MSGGRPRLAARQLNIVFVESRAALRLEVPLTLT